MNDFQNTMKEKTKSLQNQVDSTYKLLAPLGGQTEVKTNNIGVYFNWIFKFYCYCYYHNFCKFSDYNKESNNNIIISIFQRMVAINDLLFFIGNNRSSWFLLCLDNNCFNNIKRQNELSRIRLVLQFFEGTWRGQS